MRQVTGRPYINRGPRGTEYQELVHKLKEGANWTCSLCGWQAPKLCRQDIIIHHIDRNPYNDELSNLQVICSGCHYRITWGNLK